MSNTTQFIWGAILFVAIGLVGTNREVTPTATASRVKGLKTSLEPRPGVMDSVLVYPPSLPDTFVLEVLRKDFLQPGQHYANIKSCPMTMAGKRFTASIDTGWKYTAGVFGGHFFYTWEDGSMGGAAHFIYEPNYWFDKYYADSLKARKVKDPERLIRRIKHVKEWENIWPRKVKRPVAA